MRSEDGWRCQRLRAQVRELLCKSGGFLRLACCGALDAIDGLDASEDRAVHHDSGDLIWHRCLLQSSSLL